MSTALFLLRLLGIAMIAGSLSAVLIGAALAYSNREQS